MVKDNKKCGLDFKIKKINLKAIKVETAKSHPASFHLFPLLTTEFTLAAI